MRRTFFVLALVTTLTPLAALALAGDPMNGRCNPADCPPECRPCPTPCATVCETSEAGAALIR